MFTIEKNVPSPYEELRLTIAKLEPGDSVFIDEKLGFSTNACNEILKSARWDVATGAKFTTRKVEGGRRIWRVS